MDRLFSRSIRAATQLVDASEDSIEGLFKSARVLVRLEDAFTERADAHETFLLAVNQSLRFCPNIAVSLPPSAIELLNDCNKLASAVHGEGHAVLLVAANEDFRDYSAIVNIGIEVVPDLPWTSVISSGWVARLSPAKCDIPAIPWKPAPPNPIGALAAACLGTSQAFLYLLNEPRSLMPFEISLFNHEIGPPGSLDIGPPLPVEPVVIDAFLVGCGAVTNGWAYTIKRLPVMGRLRAIDRQSLRGENLGPYVAVGRCSVGRPKAEIIRDLLQPTISVTPYADEWELFKIRLEHGLTVPRLIIAGLDNVMTRHSVQRLWPESLVDMAAGGLTSQVIVKRNPEGICLLEALRPDLNEVNYAKRLSIETGLRLDRIFSSPTDPISEEDVASAPAEMREELELARQRGELICGRIVRHNLSDEADSPDFAPAVPFVTAFSGVVGAAETIKCLIRFTRPQSVHFQYSFESGRARALQMQCVFDCECNSHAA